jgi:hypothetical protein
MTIPSHSHPIQDQEITSQLQVHVVPGYGGGQLLLKEACMGTLRFRTFTSSKLVLIDKFLLKNESHCTLMTLEMTNYYQDEQTMGEYVNSFKDLIDLAGYTEDSHEILTWTHSGPDCAVSKWTSGRQQC